MATASPTTEGGGRPRLAATSRRLGERAIIGALALAAVISVLVTVGIVIALLVPSIEFFSEISLAEFFGSADWAPLFEPPAFGVLPLIIGTLSTTFWACLVALPLGLGTAIYLSEYARPRVRRTVKPVLEVLAGIPTVVLGYFALTVLTPFLRDLGWQVEIFNAFSAGVIIGILLLPTVASLSEDAMTAVPSSLREGSFGLGANRFQVSTRVVVPAAISGIVASFVLAISRAIGETTIVLLAAGQLARVSFWPGESVMTMTAFIAGTGSGDVPTGSIEYKTIFAVGMTLFVLTFVLNIISIRMVRRFREIYE
ncbi:MAG: Phosphate transporter, inner rane subunit PstC [Actinomycetota bacterium]